MFGLDLTPARLASVTLFLLSTLALFGPSSKVEATSTSPPVSRTLRAVFLNDGGLGVKTPLYGGAGMTITANGSLFDNDVVTFAPGTWTSPRTGKSCYFVPTATDYNFSSATIQNIVENADGCGSFGITAQSTGPSDLVGIIVVSADC